MPRVLGVVFVSSATGKVSLTENLLFLVDFKREFKLIFEPPVDFKVKIQICHKMILQQARFFDKDSDRRWRILE